MTVALRATTAGPGLSLLVRPEPPTEGNERSGLVLVTGRVTAASNIFILGAAVDTLPAAPISIWMYSPVPFSRIISVLDES